MSAVEQRVVAPKRASAYGDRAVGLGVDAHAAVRGADLDLLGGRVEAGVPVDDAVRARVERDVADLGRERAGRARRGSRAQQSPRRQLTRNMPGQLGGAERADEADLGEHERVDARASRRSGSRA